MGSPASGEWKPRRRVSRPLQVSNLLGSPASGESLTPVWCSASRGSFQFIGFPSEWGGNQCWYTPRRPSGFPIYWVPQRVGREKDGHKFSALQICFQFIGFPSEWGALAATCCCEEEDEDVSNLLGSPASGELGSIVTPGVSQHALFPIYWVPQRVGSLPRQDGAGRRNQVSNLLGSPASGEMQELKLLLQFLKFPIYWVPQRVGSYHH